MYSGISGLRAHQTKLDVVGNNIANVNTNGFKGSSVQFQDTLSQLQQAAAGPQAETGGTNPAQIGLGVKVAGVSTNFGQGSTQQTGRATDMMISGDGFFVTSLGGQQQYSRAGAFDLDAAGRLVAPNGAVLQGWPAVGGAVNAGGLVGDIVLSKETVTAAVATTSARVGGNLPSDAAAGTELVRDIQVFDATGTPRTLTLNFTRTAAGWDVTGADGVGNGNTSLEFTDGKLTTPGTLTVGGIAVDLSTVSGYNGMNTLAIAGQDGRRAGTLESFSLGTDGTIIGSFSNGAREAVARVAVANFTNPGGLEKAGGSAYRATANSGEAVLGTAGTAGLGAISGGALEMSNVDLSQEFVDLITAQRGFQANSRVITTSDELLGEVVQLKR